MAKQEIRGNTLRVYLYLLRHGECELREIQRALGFSTPSLASYHLNRLVKAGYVKQNEDGKYYAVKDASNELLEDYTKLGFLLVPQSLFFSVLFSILVAYFSYRSLADRAFVPFLVASALGAVGSLWYETFKLVRKLRALD
ncbi:hypothetical protein B9Q11_02165 [Candidatus Marsarchaeota G2 archaeon ECH_B_SAG-F08]|uniref:HTH arsR-type domain-containing protein n=1 Tax=Candidatus Marsarchaeota G2 archaeon ECH_B_SAG-F08 TaxID=1978165 RepID=A0A2R6BIT8_9ARCH|nr:MAG: hypothetical protein B9Q11_02165 [Candidatus Marsarchaeota G2 archaeon ECH_B_SAG-F08]